MRQITIHNIELNKQELAIGCSKIIGRRAVIAFSFFFLCSLLSFSQVTSAIDSTSIKIGEQITYHIQVETDTTSLVVFPE